jgi:group I intron endonuclease
MEIFYENKVYQIRCTINNKVYIGSTTNFNGRIYDHLSSLKLNRHANKNLQKDYNIYGPTAFEAKIISENNDIKQEDEEYRVIKSLEGTGLLYNCHTRKSKIYNRTIQEPVKIEPKKAERKKSGIPKSNILITDEIRLKIKTARFNNHDDYVISHVYLAKQLGVSPPFIGGIESGRKKSISVNHIKTLENVLKIKVNYSLVSL